MQALFILLIIAILIFLGALLNSVGKPEEKTTDGKDNTKDISTTLLRNTTTAQTIINLSHLK